MVKKVNMESKNLLSVNIENIASLFPNALVETEDGKKIDFDILRQELSNDIVEGAKERYHLDFPGKRESIVEANRKINKTLRPIKEKSVDFDNTKNIYIEGDNLEALKILQESYLGKIKCIYIDPPYNTGNDFVYNDKFSKSTKEEMIADGRMDEDGNILISKDINNDSNGRYHSDWIKMMYPRLKLARNLLSDDGIILISIDVHEVDNLKKLCDDIYGENNFIEMYVWESTFRPDNSSPILRQNVEYILCYGKIYSNILCFKGEKSETTGMPSLTKGKEKIKIIEFPENYVMTMLPDGKYKKGIKDNGKNEPWELIEDAEVKNGIFITKLILKGHSYWATDKKIQEEKNAGTEIWIKNESFVPYYNKNKDSIVRPASLLKQETVKDYLYANSEVDELFSAKKIFDNPKPTTLIKYFLDFLDDKNEIVLDFFSGSATTAHALINLNSEDDGKRQFILIQLPQSCDENKPAYKYGYKTICDIGEERIRRAGKKIKEENPMLTQNLDTGFRVYKVDSSNMKDVYYTPDKIDQVNILDMVSNVKEDRTPEDLLTQVILNLGLPLDLHIEEKMVGNNKLFFVEENALVACFDETIDLSILDEMAKVNPLKICLRESSFDKDQDKINFFEKLKKLSPDTEVTII